MNTLRFARYVHHSHLNGEVTILDEINDRYILLDQDQTTALSVSMTSGITDSFVRQLVLEKILQLAEGECLKPNSTKEGGAGLLDWSSGTYENSITRHSLKTLFKAALALCSSVYLLKRKGFHGCLQACRNYKVYPQSKEIDRQCQMDHANRILAAIKFVAPALPFRCKCMEASIALYLLLRREGLQPELNIGYQRYDFLSHAWVEIQGVAVDTGDASVSNMTKILSLGGDK
ncbi:hypothetical protein M2262_002435 [Pseudomonas sp. BIGb0408]|uniref:Microcin J25-processing protein McjB C-terminal domain-containing protein n=1 Tax=Phytopseudomonas flavescens TaxID=29435 RepID=A0A7Y9XN26_9GAMM|nr:MULTISPECIES: lasso peptide biosynthesis B2 protein [Pseudomonas]MCW2292385.1 hypothetical protein [Pseudomonas sp. BIGb0408]NYH73044.1 hypothetical protein [Pseudomonas flavescens]